MAYSRRVLKINGAERSFICDEDKDSLADVIRNLGLTGTKIGCNKGMCGACNVILDGKLVRSCVRKIKTIEDRSEVITIEGLGTADNLHPLQLAWMVYGGVQCGFCSPGFIVSAKALLDTNDSPTREEVREWFLKNRNACRCTGYKPLVDAVMAAAEVMRGERSMADLMQTALTDEHDTLIDTRVAKPTALGKVLGITDYGEDIAEKTPDMIHLAPVMPKVSHARIKNINYSEALKCDGVIKVITAKDVKGDNHIMFPIGTNYAVGDGGERPMICDEKIYHYGDVVAVVAADTRRHAREAAALVKVETEPLPEYLDVLDAVKEDAMEIHPGIPNQFLQKILKHGEDTREVFPRAAHSVEFSFHTQRQSHLVIEPDTVQVYPDDDGGITIMMKTHAIYMQRGFLAGGIGLPPEKIRVILNPSGGSFGYSFSPGTAALAAIACLDLGKPVSITFSYEEHQVFSGKRSPSYSNGRLACDENGKLIAGDLDILYDNGAFSESSNSSAIGATKYFLTPYVCQSARVLARVSYSNTPYTTAYRAPAVPAVYAIAEQMMDMLAEKAGIDPLEFRLINCWKDGDVAIWGEQPTVYVAEKLIKSMKPKYDELKKHAKANSTDNKKYGVGVALGSFNVDTPGGAEIALELMPDGSVTNYNTWEDMGQGADIGALTFTYESLKPLGLDVSQIHLVMNDTKECPDTGRSAASRQNLVNSICTKRAAEKLLDAMRKPDGTFRTYDEMVAEGIPTKYIGSNVWEANPKVDEGTGFGKFPPDQSYAGFVTEVCVDMETGKVDLVEMHCTSDVGKVTNWLSLEGQAYSGMMHAAGYALCEGDDEDPVNKLNLIQLGFPYIDFMPDGDQFTVQDNQTIRDYSGHGGTGISEGYQSSGHAAILNAIYDAAKIRLDSQPAKPEKVKAKIDALKKGTYDLHKPYYLGSDFDVSFDYLLAHPKTVHTGPVVHH